MMSLISSVSRSVQKKGSLGDKTSGECRKRQGYGGLQSSPERTSGAPRARRCPVGGLFRYKKGIAHLWNSPLKKDLRGAPNVPEKAGSNANLVFELYPL
ncbi:hypothetical protein CH373_16755 [Leptospira perolatii]|uniref:Uncharacterized protein n=1 Tax=Leptospira perolatii TaxID=2023191 RepID=A0A2M9ZIZ5_9LEPT|nr:hypothetical protein CH360_15300 [Leptospira perolatii]PJZ71992.1 hypothetical protein CH373_16755 [Leptospira perolatii]